MSDSSEPTAKKARVHESEIAQRDRVIIVGKRQFSVNSEELVEDWYIARFGSRKNNIAFRRYKLLGNAVDYGLKRFEAMCLDNIINYHLEGVLPEILRDNSEVGKKTYEKIKAGVFEAFSNNKRYVLSIFTNTMNDIQFEDVKEDVENLLLNSAQTDSPENLVYGFCGGVKPHIFQKMKKLKHIYKEISSTTKYFLYKNDHSDQRTSSHLSSLQAYVTERFINEFPTSENKSVILQNAERYSLEELMAFATDYLIAEYPHTHDCNIIQIAIMYNVEPLNEVVEDWYIARFEDWHIPRKYQQLQYAVEYGMNRLETMCLDLFTTHDYELDRTMPKILADESELGKNVYERIKTSVFETFINKDDLILHYFTNEMTDNQFENVKEDVENLLLTKAQSYNPAELARGYCGCVKTEHILKMEKLKAYVTERFINEFPTSEKKSDIVKYAERHNLDKLMAFATNYLIAEYPRTHDWKIIQIAILHNVEPLKVFLNAYLRNNYATLTEEVKDQMRGPWDKINEFIRQATQ